MPKSKKVGTKRKRKDPNRPKNAPTAYILFCQAQRPKVVAEHPNADFAATNKMLGEMWRAQPPEVQNEFKKKSSLLKMEAQKAQAKYDKEHPPESDDDEGPRKRRKKKKKDPDAPKKPTSAYFFYQREVRQQVKDDAPEGTSVRDIAKLVAERWRKLTEDEKRPYKVSAEKDRVRYRVEKEEYESKRPPPVESSSSSSSEDSSSSESDVSSDSESD